MLKYLVFIAFISTTFIAISQNIVPSPMSAFVEKTNVSSISQVWFAPEGKVGVVGKYNKMEVGFRLDNKLERLVDLFITKKGNGINPFDPEKIDVSVKLISPKGDTIKTNGFYYSPYLNDRSKDEWITDTTSYNWRLRFAPDQIGKWMVRVKVISEGYEQFKTSFTFDCVKSDHKGVLITGHTETSADKYLFQSESGETFIPLGHNITTRGENITPSKNDLHKKWIKELGDNGGNFFRMEMPAGGALPDWPIYNDYSEKLGKMYGYDEVVDLAEVLDMYFIMFRHHVEVGKKASWGLNWDCWENNPYKKGLNLRASQDYFKNTEAIKWQKNALRYIMARWGYSPRFSFYGYSEVDLWLQESHMKEDAAFEMFANWFVEMKSYIKSDLHFASDKYICSFRSSRDISTLKHPNPASRIIDESDVISLHSYSYRKNDNYKRFDYVNSFINEWKNKKPVLLEETGIEGNQGIFCCTSINFHNTIWASSFSGTMGSGMHWNWDRGIHSKGYYTEYNNLNAFFKNEDFREANYKPQKWKNDRFKSLKNATLENYALVSENKDKALGWIHNSTFYWRNIFTSNKCMKELLDSNGVLEIPCLNEDKSPALGTNKHGYTYDNKEFMDKFSKIKGSQIVEDKAKFKIKGFKKNANRIYNPWAKKHWYEITYYSTHGKVSEASIIQIKSSTIFGVLKLKPPLLDEANPDYSYKIKYLDLSKKKGTD